jgi:imidazoleglycerol-phosphate dehydratase
VDLDGSGARDIRTPVAFLNHMLDQVGRHGMLDLKIEAEGDVKVDGHHTTEDIGLTLGQALGKALGDRAGICRYGTATVPMDEACVICVLDLSGRPFLAWRAPLPKAKVGEFDSELAEVFFEGLVRGIGCNLHMRLLEGSTLHHVIEACFKAFARALREAVAMDPRSAGVPSTKGTLKD